jgi:hypothetical protein
MSPISSPRSGPGQPRPSNHQLGTRLNNPSEEERTEIEVTDPAHPLFGRRFPLLSVSDPNYYVGHAYVSYRDYMVLCLELSATDLAADTHRRRTTKLTSQSVTENWWSWPTNARRYVRPTKGTLGRTLCRTPKRSHRGDVLNPYGGDR